ncbi:MAG: DUF362 domain-containing protein [Asgard group archaeon]|nr:DUF362 domain-containing protein [Asgard group archaeon]
MKPTVAIVDIDSYSEALNIIGGINDLNLPDKNLTIKVGIYNTETKICTTVKTLNSIIKSFNKALDIKVVESDSGAGLGLDRLKIWEACYNNRITPFNLSNDEITRDVNVAGEVNPLSHVLFKPNVFISTHVPRRYENTGDEDMMNMGSIIKNLLGLIPDTKKFRFHKKLPNALLDMYEAIGGIDLAILDGTQVYLGRETERTTTSPKILVVGKDAFAVEAVGAYLVGFEPTEMPILQEAAKRGLGEIDIKRINIVGDTSEPKNMISQAFQNLIK